MAQDFTVAEFLAWARTKPAVDEYRYGSTTNCALCQFLRETGRGVRPVVGNNYWRADYGCAENTIPEVIALASRGNTAFCSWEPETFGALVERLEVVAA